jgi:carbon-monoxide dehydrogenase small subunit
MSSSIDVNFTLNGVNVKAKVAPGMSTLEMLRDEFQLTGTKYGCGEGECGACTINVDGVSVNSCLMFAADCDGRRIVTIEGLVTDPRAAELTKSFVSNGAVQCGFCTPGIVMQAWHLLDKTSHLTRDQIQRGIEGNLCRCTGYRKIVDAIAETAASSR